MRLMIWRFTNFLAYRLFFINSFSAISVIINFHNSFLSYIYHSLNFSESWVIKIITLFNMFNSRSISFSNAALTASGAFGNFSITCANLASRSSDCFFLSTSFNWPRSLSMKEIVLFDWDACSILHRDILLIEYWFEWYIIKRASSIFIINSRISMKYNFSIFISIIKSPEWRNVIQRNCISIYEYQMIVRKFISTSYMIFTIIDSCANNSLQLLLFRKNDLLFDLCQCK